MDRPIDSIHTKIWQEEPEDSNPYATKRAFCHGYDVYNDMLGNCRWVEMLFLLFQGQPPTQAQANLLEDLAVVLANPGPRDPSVHSAMCGGVGKSVTASCLMAALGVGAGQFTGAREVYLLMKLWLELENDIQSWQQVLTETDYSEVSTWPSTDHKLGFDPNGTTTPQSIATILNKLSYHPHTPNLKWLAKEHDKLEKTVQQPITIAMVSSAAFTDLEFTPEQGEMLTLLLRLPGAAAHALEQKEYGFKKFPFYNLELIKK